MKPRAHWISISAALPALFLLLAPDSNAQTSSGSYSITIPVASTDEIGSIGVTVLPGTDSLVITALLPGGPAEKTSLKKGDKIVRIDGKSLKDLKTEESVMLLRGKPGTSVVLSVLHADTTTPVDVTVARVPMSQFMSRTP